MAEVDQAAVTAATAFWAQRAGDRMADLTTSAANQARDVWADFTDWYTPAAIAARAAEAAAVSLTAQETVAELMAQYVAELNAVARGDTKIPVPRVPIPEIRGGTDLQTVHERTAKAYRLDYAKHQNNEDALQAALAREMALIEADLMLAARQAQQDAMVDLEVDRYRRLLRPELSRTGSCGLCLAASLQVYSVEDLLPIHEHCKCLTVPLIGDHDPASVLNNADKRAIYESVDARTKTELSHVRVQIREHGEYGPTLTVRGQHFTGPQDVADRSGSGGGSGGSTPPAPGGTEPPDEPLLPIDVLISRPAPKKPKTKRKPFTFAELNAFDALAPEDDPDRYFLENEQAVADWLATRGVVGTRSVQEDTSGTADRRPDGVLISTDTVEFKTLEAGGDEDEVSGTIADACRRGRTQSGRIIFDGRRIGLDRATAERGIARAVGRYGQDITELVIILADGSSVGWVHGR